MREANYSKHCAGLITWCHTFSPGKMWINGFAALQKPYCHFATQYNREIPNEGIDMDFMNLNQAAHGDREHGFTAARLRVPRKVIAGYWQDTAVQKRLGDWMRAAVGAAVSKELKVMRFGDNMREVATTLPPTMPRLRTPCAIRRGRNLPSRKCWTPRVAGRFPTRSRTCTVCASCPGLPASI